MLHKMDLHVEAGLALKDAIVAATASGAAQMLGEADFGTLKADNAADLSLLNGSARRHPYTPETDLVMRFSERWPVRASW